MRSEPDQFDREKAEEVAMAPLWLTHFDDHGVTRAWKGLDWDLLDGLFQREWIHDPKSKAKSLVFTDERRERARALFERHLGAHPTT
jgi:hypothetical protein